MAQVVRDAQGRVVSGTLNPTGSNGDTWRKRLNDGLEKKLTGTISAAIAKTVLEAARKGEPWACKLVWDTGIPKQLEVTTTETTGPPPSYTYIPGADDQAQVEEVAEAEGMLH